MFGYIKFFTTILLILQISGNVNARRRRRRRRRKLPLFTVTGRAVAKIDYSKIKPYNRILRRIDRFKRKAFWRFRDPLIYIPSHIKFSSSLVAAIYGVKEKINRNADENTNGEMRVKGMGIFPPLVAIHYKSDLSIFNAMSKKISIFSPNRIIEKKLLKPEVITSGNESIFNVGPRENEITDKSLFWSYPIRLKKYKAAKARVIFLKTKYFSIVSDTGIFSISLIPPGKYKLVFIYMDKKIKEVELKIPKRKRRSRIIYKNVKLTIPPFNLAY